MASQKTDDTIAATILEKCRYTIEIEEGEDDDYNDDGDYQGDPTLVGYFWQDMNGDSSTGYWEDRSNAVKDALENLDSTGVKLTKSEQTFLSQYQ